MSVAATQSYANRAGGAIAHKSPSLTWRYDCGYGGADKTMHLQVTCKTSTCKTSTCKTKTPDGSE
jgi:hypothetical protein